MPDTTGHMRILKVVQSYFPFQERGGPVFKVRALATGLAKRGHQVTVMTADLGFGKGNGSQAGAERCRWGWTLAAMMWRPSTSVRSGNIAR